MESKRVFAGGLIAGAVLTLAVGGCAFVGVTLYQGTKNGSSLEEVGNKTTMEKALRQLIAENSFLAGTNVDCTISASADPLAPAIKVNVVKHLSAPGFLRQLGLTSSLDISVTAVAVVNDTSEFIRNTDMVYDLGTYLWENLKFGDSNQTMSQRVAIFKQKFTDARAKWGL